MRFTRRLHRVPLATVALLLVTALRSAAPATPANAGAPNSSPFILYALAANSQQYLPLDPASLADMPGAQPIGVDELYGRLLSEDGSTLVTLPDRRTIVVSPDGPTGAERRRFDSPEPVYLARLSRDGSRLVTGIPMNCGSSSCPAPIFRLYDTRDGRLVTTLTGARLEYSGLFIDPDARRLYTTWFNRGGQREGSWPLQIAAFDLSTGNQLASLTLPNVVYTEGPTRTVDQMPVARTFVPATVFSPDGTRFAAIDATTDELTVVDTATLTVAATRTIHRTESLAHRAARWLGLAPVPAAAKTMDGRYLDAVFSVDARYLYLWGVDGSVDDVSGVSTGHGLGLNAIDVASGEIVASALADHYVSDVVPAPDGGGLYVVDSAVVPWTVDHEVPYRLSRLDTHTLRSQAEREYPRTGLDRDPPCGSRGSLTASPPQTPIQRRASSIHRSMCSPPREVGTPP